MWYGRVSVRYRKAGYGYGMVWSGMWYGIFGTVWYGRVPVSSGMWYGIFLVCGTVIFCMVVVWYVVRYFFCMVLGWCGTVWSGM